MKKWLSVLQMLPAGIVALAAVFGFQSTAPVLEAVVWPEKPVLESREEADAAPLRAEEDAAAEPAQTGETETGEDSVIPGTGSYEDGVYTGSGTGYSGTTTVRVKVEQGQIVSIDVTAHADKNPFWGRAAGVIDRVLTAQTWKVDVVSGATYSSRGILEAVKNAVTGSNERSAPPKKPRKPKKTPTEAFDDTKKLKDGTWIGSARGFGGTIKVKVTVKGGKMTKIEVTSHSGESASYFKKAKKIIPRMLKKGSPNVDTVSGATYSSKGIREAVKKALKKAVSGKTEEKEEEKEEGEVSTAEQLPTGGKPFDGTWSGMAKCEQFGYSVTLKAVFREGKLAELKGFQLLDNSDRHNVVYANQAWEGLSESIPQATGGSVDVVSGATYSSRAIVAAYRDAYDKALTGTGREPDEEEQQPEDSDSADTSEPDKEPEDDSQPEQSEPSTLKDGSYTVTVTCEPDEWEDFDAYTLTVEVTLQGGKLTALSIKTASDTSNSYYYKRAVEGSGKLKGIAEQLKSKNDSNVDTVSGATCSSKALIQAYQQAVEQAKEATT